MTVLLASIVDVTIVLGLALAAAAALKGRSAALRHAVLAAAMVAAALSPALELLVPQLPVIQWNDTSSTVSSGVTVSSGESPAMSAMATMAPEGSAVPWTLLLLAAWVLGAMVTLTRLLTGLVRLARLNARCTPVRAGPWREMADELSRAYALHRHVAIVQSADPSLLVTCGVLRPKIILPLGAAGWTDDRRQIVLAHELAHVRRRDGAMQIAGEVLRVVHWFNPLVWLSCRCLRQESECACDDVVLSSGIEATEYATHLLGVARHAAGRHQAWASAPAIAHPSTLERRIAAMLNHQRNREPLSRRGWAVAVLAVVAVIVPIAAAGVAPPPESRPVVVAGARDVALPSPLEPQVGRILSEPALVSPSMRAGSPPVRPEPVRARAAIPPEVAVRAAVADTVQQAPGQISGTISDASGAVVPGVRLTLNDTEFGVQYATVSDGAGQFRFRELQPARYELVASLAGFATVTNVLPLTAGSTVARRIMLPIGTVEETITVGCSATPAAAAAPPMRPGVAIDTPRFAARLRQVWNRTLQELVPVLSAQQQSDVIPVRVGGNIRAPRKVKDVKPTCPKMLLPATETVVRLVGRIGVDGYMNDVRPVTPEPGAEPLPEFTESALDSVRQWVFTPTLLNGQPTETNMTVTVGYRRM